MFHIPFGTPGGTTPNARSTAPPAPLSHPLITARPPCVAFSAPRRPGRGMNLPGAGIKKPASHDASLLIQDCGPLLARRLRRRLHNCLSSLSMHNACHPLRYLSNYFAGFFGAIRRTNMPDRLPHE